MLLLSIHNLTAQHIIDQPILEEVSLSEHAQIFNARHKKYSIKSFIENQKHMVSDTLAGPLHNIGFSQDYIWVTFEIKNETDEKLNYFLETARPIIDEVILYTQTGNKQITVQQSGDLKPFEEKSIPHRKTLFAITLEPNSLLKGYINLKSDGESLIIPLKLHSSNNLFKHIFKEQILFGLFYGILFLAFIFYFLFYKGFKDVIFLYYSFYILFIGLLQFSIDGLFHEYITPNGGWLNNVAVLLMANFSFIFFLSYSYRFLQIERNRLFSYIFKITGLFVTLVIFSLFIPKNNIALYYPITNIMGLIVMLQVVAIAVLNILNGKKPDSFYLMGIGILCLAFVTFIFANLNILPATLVRENIIKLGTSLEIILFSISMSNRVKALRLENEVNEKTSLQRKNDLNDIKSYFLSNLSHELRTPLNLIMGVASSIESETSTTNLREQVELITASSKSLISSINDIVDFTDIEKGNYTLREAPFNLHELLLKVQDNIAPLAEEKNLNFERPYLENLPQEIIGDEKKLTQILTNLLDNAVKFTNAGEIALRVKVSNLQKSKTRLTFYIRDTGIGISDEKVRTAFESFTKHSFDDKRQFDGLGLGLYIAKAYIDLQGGSINLRKNSDAGTTCKIQMDYELVSAEADEQPALRDCKILLVEDNKMNQTVIKLFMKKYPGVKLVIANNGQEGLEQLKADKFDIVLMDLQMPIMDGFEAIEKIRKESIPTISNSIPIIVLTADCTVESYTRVQKLGVNDFMTKPILEKLLLQKIKTVVDAKLKIAS